MLNGMAWFRMRGWSARGAFALVTLVCFASRVWGHGAEFKLSFLDYEPVMRDTCSLLESNGFGEAIVKDFKHLVQHHNRNGNRVDLEKYPLPFEGYYHFLGIQDFGNRLKAFFAETPGDGTLEQTTLTCFDVAVLLLKGTGHDAGRLYDNFASKDIVVVSRERQVGPVIEATFRSGTGLLFPLDGYHYLVGRSRTDAETQLGLSLRAARKLRVDLTDSDQDLQAAFAEFVSDVKQDGFTFPKNFRLGLVFYVDVKRHFVLADHAFICIQNAERLVLLEKNNASGPYVRAEFGSEEDLALYSSMAERWDSYNPKDVDYGSSVMVSLNDRLVGIYRPAVAR